jgi:AcrR family transcriptional regulator
MPPKQRFKKEDILKTAFQLVREQGIDNLNVRSIAKMLHSSTQPVFSCYENMADLKADLLALVKEYQDRYVCNAESGENLFLNVGMAYVDFAIEEPNLFKMLYMSNSLALKSLYDLAAYCDENDPLSQSIPEESNRIYTDMWLYAHGIASMIVMNQLSIDRNEIKSMIKNMHDMLTGKQLREKKHEEENIGIDGKPAKRRQQ